MQGASNEQNQNDKALQEPIWPTFRWPAKRPMLVYASPKFGHSPLEMKRFLIPLDQDRKLTVRYHSIPRIAYFTENNLLQ
jgi:hypothetical protein